MELIGAKLPIDWSRLMVSESREYGNTGEHIRHLFHCILQDFQIFFFSLIPHIVGW